MSLFDRKRLYKSTKESDVEFYSKHLMPDVAVYKFDMLDGGLEALVELGADISSMNDHVVVGEHGISWGTNDWNNASQKIVLPVDEKLLGVRIVWSGSYNNPSGGLGQFYIRADDGRNNFASTDAWDSYSSGQSLVVNRKSVFNRSMVDIVDREDYVKVFGSKTLEFAMASYQSYPYTRRWLRSIELVYKDNAREEELYSRSECVADEFASSRSYGAGYGVAVTGIYERGSTENMLEGKPILRTSNGHYCFYHSGFRKETGYNYMGGHNWFINNGVDAYSAIGGVIEFENGIRGIIDSVSNGCCGSESAYIYYCPYSDIPDCFKKEKE